MKFEEWFKVEYPNQHVFKESTPTCKSFYDGASVAWDYKQAEIDALQKRIDELEAKREGFVLVPRKPTHQIYRAFYDAFNSANAGNTAQCFKVGYKAMLSAVEVQD